MEPEIEIAEVTSTPSSTSKVLPYFSASPKAKKNKWRAAGTATKRVACEKCDCAFRYELSRNVRAWSLTSPLLGFLLVSIIVSMRWIGPLVGGGALAFVGFVLIRIVSRAVMRVAVAGGIKAIWDGNDAAVSSNKRLRRSLERAVEAVSCPKCGWYQSEMVAKVRSSYLGWIRRIMFGLCVIAPVIWLVMWQKQSAQNLKIFQFDASDPLVLAITITAAVVLLLVILFTLRWALSFTVDPNRLYPALPKSDPNVPVAVVEAEWNKKMASQISKITLGRQASATSPRNEQRRIVPPRM